MIAALRIGDATNLNGAGDLVNCELYFLIKEVIGISCLLAAGVTLAWELPNSAGQDIQDGIYL